MPSNINAEAVARAVAAERERCARIVKDFIRACGSVNGREAAAEIFVRIQNSNS